MQNKRGIARAFSRPPAGTILRQATLFDVFELSTVLIASITQLCAKDHHNEPDQIVRWSANKDPASIRRWISEGAQIHVIEKEGHIAGVGAITHAGWINLLYMSPEFVGAGLGKLLLRHLEHLLAQSGHIVARLDATRTAFGFYESQGWNADGAPKYWNGIPQFPMRKSLHPVD